ncbi:uncharacterized protein F4812DRAFT_408346 [Daldinia caldariorum]|uniref:uncharacterized protein n=1 Tax=Daldinia caldariorum TaxID=326644 RepID=UPI002008C77A|nr:uncharacterized protein F4812DRAFT_408346 [Daldinia caldariorum]KAI1472306.1 hypothetical protein F4812DRAFT_408346 [Daldinia caldariorum]
MAVSMQVMHSSASSNHQSTPGSTAPVLDYVCLFTRDLRRKQKRWQDGRLKYHTFNKRIMVYDDRGNFVGDTHWHEDYDFDEGEEVELERGGTIVQVAECTGSRDQDLSELIDKRARERAERQSAALARRLPAVEASTPNVATPHFQLRHKPLHNLIGTPTGHHGRAVVPTESPYEERQKQAAPAQDGDTRPAKRRKRDVSPPSKSGYAQSLFGASLTLSATPASSPLLRSRPPKLTSVSVDNQSVSSAIPSTRDSSSGAAPVPVRGLNRRVHGDMRNTTTRGATSKDVNQEHSATTSRDSIEPQPSLLPLCDQIDISEQRPSRANERQLGVRRREQTTGRCVDVEALQPTSINLLSKGQENYDGPPLFKDNHNALGDTASAANSINRKAESAPSMLGPNKSVRSQGLPTKTKSKNKANMVENTKEHLELVQEPSISEPRTELRIKPRKKRGLVMVSEKLNNDSPSASKTSKSQIDYQDQPASLSDIAKADEDEDIEDSSINIDSGTKKYDPARPSSPVYEYGTPVEGTRSSRSRNELSRKKKERLRTGDSADSYLTTEMDNENRNMANEDDTARLDDVPAPRLAQLGRRSVRSKEVIGLILDEEINNDNNKDSGLQWNERGGEYGKASLTNSFSANHSAAQPPLAKKARAVSNGGSPESLETRNISVADVKEISRLPQEQTRPTPARVSGDSDVQALLSDDTAATRLPAAKMVVNPATRGRKAAKPSDAAGHVPQCPLPSETTLGRPQDPGRHELDEQKTRSEARRKACGAAMPGFATANGGPWSREAHDLFEFTRPL